MSGERSLAARPGVADKVSDWKPEIQLAQDSSPDGQPMEGTAYLGHSALGVSLDSGLMEGMLCTEPLDRSVFRVLSVVRPEETGTPECPENSAPYDYLGLELAQMEYAAVFTDTGYPCWSTH